MKTVDGINLSIIANIIVGDGNGRFHHPEKFGQQLLAHLRAIRLNYKSRCKPANTPIPPRESARQHV